MKPATHDAVAILAQQREELALALRRAEQAHCLGIIDHLAAKIRARCPEAVYVAIDRSGEHRAVTVHGVLGEQPSPLGACPWLWDGTETGHPLNEIDSDITLDIEYALLPPTSPVRALVQHNMSMDDCWLLELPPADRAACVAELIRGHHPAATAVIVDGRAGGGRVVGVIEEQRDGKVPAPVARPRLSSACDDALTRLVAQVFLLPPLADRHLMPVPRGFAHPHGSSASDQVRLMPLPPTA
ncbi:MULTISPECIES: hypothetical protein [Streptomyces]|uniref:CBS domain-containing protein n=1 Tax=Streptomyces malaysiensis TaxID=92644 RepID=A0ABX6W8M8_STRMQ|nr:MULTISPECIES: hypothetical protein [Streptomyces]QPI56126.1 hypothetical protein I1A49_15340 [Streptomyces solisilvae]UHH17597.1 hypothetical protein LUV23_15460 [Streptomyces sp. HNM0561]